MPAMVNEEQMAKLLDRYFRNNFKDLKSELYKQLNDQMASHFSKLDRYFDKKFAEQDKRLDTKIDKIWAAVDNLIKHSETGEIERLALGAQVDRHEAWIKRHANNKLH
jgi:hypothetical protein